MRSDHLHVPGGSGSGQALSMRLIKKSRPREHALRWTGFARRCHHPVKSPPREPALRGRRRQDVRSWPGPRGPLARPAVQHSSAAARRPYRSRSGCTSWRSRASSRSSVASCSRCVVLDPGGCDAGEEGCLGRWVDRTDRDRSPLWGQAGRASLSLPAYTFEWQQADGTPLEGGGKAVQLP